MSTHPQPFILCIGNAFDGIKVYGPFSTAQEAIYAAPGTGLDGHGEMHVMQLLPAGLASVPWNKH